MLTGQRLDDHVRSASAKLSADLLTASRTTDPDKRDVTIGNAMQSCLDQLALSECWGRANQIPSSLLWNENQQMLERGGLQTHARRKPLGYAGDYQLLDRICCNDVTEGPTDDPVGRAMDRFFQAQAAPQAVRNRYRMMASNIAEQSNARRSTGNANLRVTSVGSGPGWDIYWALEPQNDDLADRLEVTLVDIDPGSLQHCESLLSTKRLAQLNTIQANLGRLPRLKNVLSQLDGSDLIYCAGYFDYLDDDSACEMLRALWTQVAPGGELFVFNFNLNNPSRAYMEWIGNWYLNYRTEASLNRLAQNANLDGARIEVGVEPTGVNLFLRCAK